MGKIVQVVGDASITCVGVGVSFGAAFFRAGSQSISSVCLIFRFFADKTKNPKSRTA